MQVHLSLIETRLKPRAAPEAEIDAEQAIAEAWADSQGELAPSAA